MRRPTRAGTIKVAAATLAATGLVSTISVTAVTSNSPTSSPSDAPTSTPIKHLVLIFQENISFDHYFGTYPNAANPSGEPGFTAKRGTPSVNGLTSTLLTQNPNSANPQRLDHSQAITFDQDHGYTAEQQAFDRGLMDKFVESSGATGTGCDPKQVMDYYDGNSVTALWNYAQHFAMSDNSFSTGFGRQRLARSTWCPARHTARPLQRFLAMCPTGW